MTVRPPAPFDVEVRVDARYAPRVDAGALRAAARAVLAQERG